MQYKLCELDDLFSNIRTAIENYENVRKNDKEFTIYMANGETIKIKFGESNVAHLLGINIDYFKLLKLTREENSYTILKCIIDNPLNIYTKINNGIIDSTKLFSEYINEKVNSFIDNININLKDIEFLCVYDSKKTYAFQDDFERCDIIMVKKYEDESYGIITFVRKGETYYPMSNRSYTDFNDAKEDLEKFLKNQEITIASGVQIYDLSTYKSTKPFNLMPSDKIKKVNSILGYKSKFGCIPNVTNDYKYLLKRTLSNYQTNDEEKVEIESIVESIKNGTIINPTNEDSRLIEIINAHNDSLCSNSDSKTENINTYTSLKKEVEELKQELLKLKNANTELIITAGTYEQENNELSELNKEYVKKLNKIYELSKPSN